MNNLIKVDKFESISFLDDGGYGLVFRVNTQNTPSLALKVLRNEKRIAAFDSFKQEFMVMQNFAGKHVLNYYEFVARGRGVTKDGQVIEVTYIVMDLASMSLFNLLEQNGGLSERAAHYLLVNTLKAIEFVHEKEFSH